MARKSQKLINFHGSVKANLEAAKGSLNKGEIAVVHVDQKDSLLAIKADNSIDLVYFITSGAVEQAISTVAGDANTLRSDVDAISGQTAKAIYSFGSGEGDNYIGVVASATSTNNFNNAANVGVALKSAVKTSKEDVAAVTATGSLVDAKAVKEVSGALATEISTLSGNAYTAISGEADRAKGIEEGLRSDVNTLSGRVGSASVQTQITDQISKLDAEVASTEVKGFKVTVAETDGKLSGVTITVPDLATASDFKALSGSVVTLSGATKSVEDKANTNADAITTLNGDASTSGSVAYAVDKAIARVVSGAPEAFDTLKEIADWIGSEASATTAAQMLSDINALKSASAKTASGLSTLSGAVVTLSAATKSVEDKANTNADAITELSGATETIKATANSALQSVSATTGNAYLSAASTGNSNTKGTVSYTANVSSELSAETGTKLADAKNVWANIKAVSASLATEIASITGDTGTLRDDIDTVSGAVVTLSGKVISDYATSANTVAAIKAAVDALDAEVEGQSSQKQVTVKVAETDGKLSGIVVTQSEAFATSAALVTLEGKVTTLEGAAATAVTSEKIASWDNIAAHGVSAVTFTSLASVTRTDNNSGVNATISGNELQLDLDELTIDCGDF